MDNNRTYHVPSLDYFLSLTFFDKPLKISRKKHSWEKNMKTQSIRKNERKMKTHCESFIEKLSLKMTMGSISLNSLLSPNSACPYSFGPIVTELNSSNINIRINRGDNLFIKSHNNLPNRQRQKDWVVTFERLLVETKLPPPRIPREDQSTLLLRRRR